MTGTAANGSATTDQALWDGLKDQARSFLGIGIAFLVLCNLWAIQTRSTPRRWVSPRFVLLNTRRLLVPFATSVATHYDELIIGRLLKPVDILWIVTLGVITGWHARSAGLLPDEHAHVKHRAAREQERQ